MKLPTLADGKSGTREFAVANTLGWWFLTLWQYFMRDPSEVEAYFKTWDAITTAVWLFNASAFSLAVAAKQGWFGGGSRPQATRRGQDSAEDHVGAA